MPQLPCLEPASHDVMSLEVPAVEAVRGDEGAGSVGVGARLQPEVPDMLTVPTLSSDVDAMPPLVCPPYLATETRIEFRAQALDALDAAVAAGANAVVLDLAAVVQVDASGLGVLILLQKRAREKGLRVRLTALPSPLERMFDETQLRPLFDVVAGV